MDTRQWMAILLCTATALMLFVLFLSYQRRHLPAAKTMIWMIAAASCYAFGYGLEILADNLESVKRAYQLEYLGIPFVSAFWLLLVFQFTGFASAHRRRIAAAFFLIPVTTFILHLTNDWHHLIYIDFVPNTTGTVPLYITVKGPWYMVHSIYNYTTLLFGMLLFIPMYLRATAIVRKQIAVLIVGVVMPMLFNIAYMFNKEIDFTPLGFAFSGLFYAWGIFRFRLLRLTPLAYEKMFDTMTDGVILLDYEDQIVSHNSAATNVYPELHRPKGAAVSIREALAESPELQERLSAADWKDDRFPLERVVGGRTKHYMCSLTYIYDNDKTPIGKMMMLSDVTELRENEERLQEKSERLMQLNAFKDKLFTVMAHDIRDPISLLVSLTELLEEKSAEPDKTKTEVLPEIKRQVRGTFHLVDNLLDWYRSQNGNIVFRPMSWNLQQVVRQALSLAGTRAAMKNIRIAEHIDDTLLVQADKEMLDLILRNLLSNAIKYTELGGRIEIGASISGSRVTVLVSDNGSGIDEETAKLLRHDEMFFKEPAFASGDDSGEMRFGLVLTREFLRIHGGNLWFESKPGLGTTFAFTLTGSAGEDAVHDKGWAGISANENIVG